MSQLAMFQLTEDDQQLLLQIARNSVRFYLLSQSPRLPDMPAAVMTEVRGIFVSIQRNGELRGEIGTHGPLISKKNARGLLLLPVALTCGWSRKRFLEEVCKKAGLRPDDCKDGATIHCFSAFVFGDKQFHSFAAT